MPVVTLGQTGGARDWRVEHRQLLELELLTGQRVCSGCCSSQHHLHQGRGDEHLRMDTDE